MPHDGNYKNARYDIIWHNFTSGPPLNSELLADKLDIGNMADFPIVSQAPEVAGSALKANQIDAHADFVPFGELFPFRGIARKIYDGSASGVTTTHGIQVRSDFAEKYPELVVAYLRATLEADRLIRENPEDLSEKLAQWTGIEPEVCYAFHGPWGIQTRDFTLKPEFIKAIRQAEITLRQLKKTSQPLDIDAFVNDRFIREAAKESGIDYAERLKDYSPVAFAGNAEDIGAPVSEPRLAGQIWIKGESKVRLFSTPQAAFVAARKEESEGKAIRVVYVHDRESGLKLFADKAWYVSQESKLAAFLLKSSADNWAAKNGGAVLGYPDARRSVDARLTENE